MSFSRLRSCISENLLLETQRSRYVFKKLANVVRKLVPANSLAFAAFSKVARTFPEGPAALNRVFQSKIGFPHIKLGTVRRLSPSFMFRLSKSAGVFDRLLALAGKAEGVKPLLILEPGSATSVKSLLPLAKGTSPISGRIIIPGSVTPAKSLWLPLPGGVSPTPKQLIIPGVVESAGTTAPKLFIPETLVSNPPIYRIRYIKPPGGLSIPIFERPGQVEKVIPAGPKPVPYGGPSLFTDDELSKFFEDLLAAGKGGQKAQAGASSGTTAAESLVGATKPGFEPFFRDEAHLVEYLKTRPAYRKLLKRFNDPEVMRLQTKLERSLEELKAKGFVTPNAYRGVKAKASPSGGAVNEPPPSKGVSPEPPPRVVPPPPPKDWPRKSSPEPPPRVVPPPPPKDWPRKSSPEPPPASKRPGGGKTSPKGDASKKSPKEQPPPVPFWRRALGTAGILGAGAAFGAGPYALSYYLSGSGSDSSGGMALPPNLSSLLGSPLHAASLGALGGLGLSLLSGNTNNMLTNALIGGLLGGASSYLLPGLVQYGY